MDLPSRVHPLLTAIPDTDKRLDFDQLRKVIKISQTLTAVSQYRTATLLLPLT